jgi:hypothetical protein
MEVVITIPDSILEDFKEMAEFEVETYSAFALNAVILRMNDNWFDDRFLKYLDREDN